MRAFKLHELSLADRLADMAVDALIDEADLSPKPALVDRRGNGAHSDLHLGLMHASALSLWPMFKEMAEAALEIGEIGLPLREALGRIGREREQAMIITTHHIDEIIPEIERVVLLDRGRIVADGPKADILTSANLSKLYQTQLRVTEQDGWYRCWHG